VSSPGARPLPVSDVRGDELPPPKRAKSRGCSSTMGHALRQGRWRDDVSARRRVRRLFCARSCGYVPRFTPGYLSLAERHDPRGATIRVVEICSSRSDRTPTTVSIVRHDTDAQPLFFPRALD